MKGKKDGLDLSIPETAVFKKGKLKCIITSNKTGKISVNHNVKDVSFLKIRLCFKNFIHKKCNHISKGPGVFQGLKFEDMIYKKQQLQREANGKLKKEKGKF